MRGGGGSGEGALGGFSDFFTGGSAQKAEINPDSINVTFADVAGCDEAKIEILELRSPYHLLFPVSCHFLPLT